MAWLSRILAPVEFSPPCRGATQYAETLASHFHSELILLHVVPPPLNVFSNPEAAAYSGTIDITGERVEESKHELEAYLGSEHPDVPLTEDVVTGDPAHEIVNYAHSHSAGLIVMATHGYGPLRRLLLGSVTASVLRTADCPVWTGSHLESAPSYRKIAFRRVVCALDLARRSRAVLEWAGRFAREFSAELIVVHVLPHSFVESGGIYFDPAWRQDAISEARQEIRHLQQETDAPGEVLIEMGDTAVVLNDVVASHQADLLVIGRGKESGVLPRRHTHAYNILRESPCPAAAV